MAKLLPRATKETTSVETMFTSFQSLLGVCCGSRDARARTPCSLYIVRHDERVHQRWRTGSSLSIPLGSLVAFDHTSSACQMMTRPRNYRCVPHTLTLTLRLKRTTGSL
ncbi:hypothetical protein Plhal304r1_c034g0107321 [Plasmopara halstedii]